jgi:hypothetical protein
MGASARPIHLIGSIGLIVSSQRLRRAGEAPENGPSPYAPVPVKCETSPPSPEARVKSGSSLRRDQGASMAMTTAPVRAKSSAIGRTWNLSPGRPCCTISPANWPSPLGVTINAGTRPPRGLAYETELTRELPSCHESTFLTSSGA